MCACRSFSSAFFPKETAIILTRGLLTQQETQIQLTLCESHGEAIHYSQSRCITTQTLIKPACFPEIKCISLPQAIQTLKKYEFVPHICWINNIGSMLMSFLEDKRPPSMRNKTI